MPQEFDMSEVLGTQPNKSTPQEFDLDEVLGNKPQKKEFDMSEVFGKDSRVINPNARTIIDPDTGNPVVSPFQQPLNLGIQKVKPPEYIGKSAEDYAKEARNAERATVFAHSILENVPLVGKLASKELQKIGYINPIQLQQDREKHRATDIVGNIVAFAMPLKAISIGEEAFVGTKAGLKLMQVMKGKIPTPVIQKVITGMATGASTGTQFGLLNAIAEKIANPKTDLNELKHEINTQIGDWTMLGGVQGAFSRAITKVQSLRNLRALNKTLTNLPEEEALAKNEFYKSLSNDGAFQSIVKTTPLKLNPDIIDLWKKKSIGGFLTEEEKLKLKIYPKAPKFIQNYYRIQQIGRGVLTKPQVKALASWEERNITKPVEIPQTQTISENMPLTSKNSFTTTLADFRKNPTGVFGFGKTYQGYGGGKAKAIDTKIDWTWKTQVEEAVKKGQPLTQEVINDYKGLGIKYETPEGQEIYNKVINSSKPIPTNEPPKTPTVETLPKELPVGEGINVYRGDISKVDVLKNYDVNRGIKEGKELGSAFSEGAGIYFTDNIKTAERYGENISNFEIPKTANIITSNTKKFTPKDISSMLDKVDKETLDLALSNWDENPIIAKNKLIKAIVENDNAKDELMTIWSDVYYHQNPEKFMDNMKQSGIDGLKIVKDKESHYVIYNKDILTTPLKTPTKVGEGLVLKGTEKLTSEYKSLKEIKQENQKLKTEELKKITFDKNLTPEAKQKARQDISTKYRMADKIAEHKQMVKELKTTIRNKPLEPEWEQSFERFAKFGDELDVPKLRQQQNKLVFELRQKQSAIGKKWSEKIAKGEVSSIEGRKLKLKEWSTIGSAENVPVLFKGIENDIENLNQIIDRRTFGFESEAGHKGLDKLLRGQLPEPKQLELLQEIFGDSFIKKLQADRNLWNYASSFINMFKAFQATFDLSFPLRQGMFFANKRAFWNSMQPMLSSFAKEKNFQTLLQSIKDNPYYEEAIKYKLPLTDFSKNREELFWSQAPEKIPVLGRFARASNRAYVAFADKLRMDTFANLASNAKRLGLKLENVNPKTNLTLGDEIAKFVGMGSGRGDLGKLSIFGSQLNTVFFSPMLIKSRLEILNPVRYINATPFVRKEMLKSLSSYLAIQASILGSAYMIAPNSVETDMRSTDWGKIKIGKTRIDMSGGILTYVKNLMQIFTEQRKSSTTGHVRNVSRTEFIENILKNKTAPVTNFVWNYAGTKVDAKTGKRMTPWGDEYVMSDEIKQRFVPMIMSDIKDLYNSKELGGLEELIIGILGVGGAGVQTY